MQKKVLMWIIAAAALVLAVTGCQPEKEEDTSPEQRELRGRLAASVEWLKNNARSDSTYTIVLSSDEQSGPISLLGTRYNTAGRVERVTVILTGEGQERGILLNLPEGGTSSGSLLWVGESVSHFVLDKNITLGGVEDNDSPLVSVNPPLASANSSQGASNRGRFEMREGAKIIGNKGGGVAVYGGVTFTMTGGEIFGNTARDSGGGGGVSIYGGSAFTMSGGEIHANTARGNGGGGGVYVAEGGTFTMSGGKIYNNPEPDPDNNAPDPSSVIRGGGVSAYGAFTMSGGEIYGNTTGYEGGGVYAKTFTMSGGEIYNNKAIGPSSSRGGGVYASITFTMTGGEIYGNTSASVHPYGGGVYAYAFTKTHGGIISGYSDEDPFSNRVTNETEEIQPDKGHAVYVSDSKHCEETVDALHALNSTKTGTEGGWDEGTQTP